MFLYLNLSCRCLSKEMVQSRMESTSTDDIRFCTSNSSLSIELPLSDIESDDARNEHDSDRCRVSS
jgi:hypothetical protein